MEDQGQMVTPADIDAAQAHRGRGRPGQMDSGAREEEILRVTKALLMNAALDEITMAAIARETGMSKRTIYDHFDSLETLLRRSLAEIGKVIFQPLNAAEKALPLKERLTLLLTLNKPPSCEVHKREFLRTLIAKAHVFPYLSRTLCENGRCTLCGYLGAEMHTAVRAGELSIAPDRVEMAAEILMDMAFWDPMPSLLDPDYTYPFDGDVALRRAVAIEMFLNGCVNRAP
jgi:AcrR family transcriptional regulator